MKTQPKLSAKYLKKWLQRFYALQADRVQFMPRGECSWGFVITAQDGQRYFLKLWMDGLCDRTMTPQVVKTMMALYYDFGINQMAPPPLRATTGQYVNKLERYDAVLLHFVPGIPATDSVLTQMQLKYLGVLLGNIHTCKISSTERPPMEDFSPHFIEQLQEIMREVDYPNGFYTPIQSELLQILRRARQSLTRLLQDFISAHQMMCLRDPNEFVVCHGDPSHGNIVITPDHQIALIDWDNPVYGPPERDVFFIQDQSVAMDGYRSVIGDDYEPDETAIRFYQLHWHMQEIVEHGGRTLYTKQSEEQNEYDTRKVVSHLKGIGIL